MSTEEKKYIQDNNDIVYKVMPNHLLKLSPWEDGEDRRVMEKDIDGYKYISYKNACMIINTQFANTVEKWNHKGKNYIANSIGTNKNIEEYTYLLSTLPNHTLTITNNDNLNELKLIRHKGKIYYIMIINEYLPRVQLYNLFGDFCQWCGITDCKPIFNETDKKYI
ncbi:hypothetical protein J6O48_00320 [bacterium]|nr:hypothetical protein [bacterium]